MPYVQYPEVLAAVYAAVERLISTRNIPTQQLYRGQTLYHYCDPKYLPKPANGPILRSAADDQLKPYDGSSDGGNRFSGPSYCQVPFSGGLYCALQQQALANERIYYFLSSPKDRFNPIMGLDKLIRPEIGSPGLTHPHYSKKEPYGSAVAAWAWSGIPVVQIELTAPMLVADLSPHNPGLESFLKEVESTDGLQRRLEGLGSNRRVSLWDAMTDGQDCSVARGIGLAVARSGYLRGLCVQTVRQSERSVDEMGDNVVLFGLRRVVIPGLKVVRAYYPSKEGMDIVPFD